MSAASNASAPVSAGNVLFAAPPPRHAQPAKDDSFNAAMNRAAESQAAASRAAARARDNAPKDSSAAAAQDGAPADMANAPAGPGDAQWLAQFAAMMGHAHPGFPGTLPAQAGAGAASGEGVNGSGNGSASVPLPGQPGFAATGAGTATAGLDGKPVDPSATAADGVLSLAGLNGQAPTDTEFLDRLASMVSGGSGRRADGVTGSSKDGWGNVADAATDAATGLVKGAAGALLRGADIVPGFAAVAAAATAAASVANAAASAVSAASAALGGDAASGGASALPGAAGTPDASAAVTTAAVDAAGTPVPAHGVGAHATPANSRADSPTIPGAPASLHGQALQGRLDEALRWMTGNGLQNAELRVTPDALGPITIHVRMDGDTASVMFGTAHEQTRQALEASLGGLRDALAAGGMTLGDTSVGSEQQQRQMLADFGNGDRRQNRADAAPAEAVSALASGAAAGVAGDTTTPAAPRRGNGLLNVYA
ncbi:flagellar hook-length control protein FliK [Pigmentiphaga litoralis]|uniref:Flagellar hook-length control protein FliK n=1 Tax=Pigmentiphaga litoralis TaxID=516702 RepID=A0A7Y9IZ82_9BURK|nr:flagellar hook-length control protein FliK [Pigmentiphaga litoralis]NYE26858.1 flagellar hook-length control protein FliK [Pigmentiphaga litoralis]NYE85732.1 flagellar hook-length control protein FliK [Pigmentiphaga litoralis]